VHVTVARVAGSGALATGLLAAGALVAVGGARWLLLALLGALIVVAASAVLRRPERGLVVLALALAVFPVARMEIGSMPLYVTDVLIALTLAGLCGRVGPAGGFGALVLVYLVSWLPAWLLQMAKLGVVLEPTYGLVRNALAVATFFAAYALGGAVSRGAWKATCGLAAGVLVTGVVAVAQVFPRTEGAVRELLLAIAPAFSAAGYSVYPNRAFALFAAATILAGFLAVALPLLLAAIESAHGRTRALLAAAAVAASVGMLATYSRQWLPALSVGLLVLGLLKPGMAGRLLALGAVAAAVVFFVGGGALDRGYLADRFGSLGTGDTNVQTRLERQRTFFSVAADQPLETLAGRGFAGQDLVARRLVDDGTAQQIRAGVNDNAFLLELFNHGLVAALLYVGLIAAALGRAVRVARRPGPQQAIAAGLAAALAAAVALHFCDNYFSETVFMKTFLWMLVGLAASLGARRPALWGFRD
jgi:O-antigen ligase